MPYFQIDIKKVLSELYLTCSFISITISSLHSMQIIHWRPLNEPEHSTDSISSTDSSGRDPLWETARDAQALWPHGEPAGTAGGSGSARCQPVMPAQLRVQIKKKKIKSAASLNHRESWFVALSSTTMHKGGLEPNLEGLKWCFIGLT